MNEQMFIDKLVQLGIPHEIHPTFDGMVEKTGMLGRIIVSEKIGGKNRGLSFWVHYGGGEWYVGLWSSRLYRFSKECDIVLFVTQLYQGTSLPLGVTPVDLSREIIEHFNLVEEFD